VLELERASVRRAFLEGLLCNLLNPKATLFFFSVFTQLLRPDSTLTEKALIGLVIFLLGVIYWPCVALAVQHPRVMALLHRAQRRIDRLLGGVLVALGVKVALS
jgi:threonine/homoserine/homoserine lactone efflux protein